jgi:5-methylcytosine-specific restriction endonuclease McrA
MLEKIPNPRAKHLNGITKFDYLWNYQRGQCFYCKKKMELPIYKVKATKRTATLDHVKPLSKGGKRPKNLVLACQECNSKKSSMPAHEFVVLIRKEPRHE